jgi:hypothetical protein
MDRQPLDSSTPCVENTSTTFTRFQIPPSDISRLSIHLEPKAVSLPSPTPPLPCLDVFAPPQFEYNQERESATVRRATEKVSSSSVPTTLLRWAPFLAFVLALLVARLSGVDAPLNDLIASRTKLAFEVFDPRAPSESDPTVWDSLSTTQSVPTHSPLAGVTATVTIFSPPTRASALPPTSVARSAAPTYVDSFGEAEEPSTNEVDHPHLSQSLWPSEFFQSWRSQLGYRSGELVRRLLQLLGLR